MTEKPFICDQGECTKSFPTEPGLRMHKKAAHNISLKKPDSGPTGDKAVLDAISGINTKLGNIDENFCSKFPALCAKVEAIESRLPAPAPRMEKGSEEWKVARKADLEHLLFDDCPDCGPVRDEVLTAKGKKLAEVEPKGGGDGGDGGPETSRVPKAGFKFDYDRKIYVRKEG